MKNFIFITFSLFLLTCCQNNETYQMPNYFKHHEKGNVKQITINTSQIMDNGLMPYPQNWILIWGEDASGTSIYDRNGNIISDNSYDYSYDEKGKLLSTTSKFSTPDGRKSTLDFSYNTLYEIQHWGDREYRYNDNNQIISITENNEPYGYSPGSYREYEYNDDGQMKSCNFNHSQEIYGSEYNSDGELIRHVQMMSQGKIQKYFINITKRDEKGNWIERVVNGTDYNGTPVQYKQVRELIYY